MPIEKWKVNKLIPPTLSLPLEGEGVGGGEIRPCALRLFPFSY